jgi:acetolactate synthase-1/3 small subunit
MNKILSVLVRNHAGVLSHVAGLFTRRGYNIESLVAGVTADPEISRLTIAIAGDEAVVDQVKKQINKLIDVISVEELTYEDSITRELLLMTIFVSPDKRHEVINVSNILEATVADISETTMTIEFTGNSLKINNIIKALDTYEIKELARTGLLALPLESNLGKKIGDRRRAPR